MRAVAPEGQFPRLSGRRRGRTPVISPLIDHTVHYDVERDLVPVATVATGGLLLVANSALPAHEPVRADRATEEEPCPSWMPAPSNKSIRATWLVDAGVASIASCKCQRAHRPQSRGHRSQISCTNFVCLLPDPVFDWCRKSNTTCLFARLPKQVTLAYDEDVRGERSACSQHVRPAWTRARKRSDIFLPAVELVNLQWSTREVEP